MEKKMDIHGGMKYYLNLFEMFKKDDFERIVLLYGLYHFFCNHIKEYTSTYSTYQVLLNHMWNKIYEFRNVYKECKYPIVHTYWKATHELMNTLETKLIDYQQTKQYFLCNEKGFITDVWNTTSFRQLFKMTDSYKQYKDEHYAMFEMYLLRNGRYHIYKFINQKLCIFIPCLYRRNIDSNTKLYLEWQTDCNRTKSGVIVAKDRFIFLEVDKHVTTVWYRWRLAHNLRQNSICDMYTWNDNFMYDTEYVYLVEQHNPKQMWLKLKLNIE
jgi:hypothetical protein